MDTLSGTHAPHDRASSPRGVPLVASLRTKLVATVTLAAIASIGVGLTALRETSLVSAKGESIYTRALVPNQILSTLRETVVQARFDVVSRSAAKSRAAYRSANADLKADELRIARLTAQYAAIGLSPRQASLLKTFDRAWVSYKHIRDRQMTPALDAGNLVLYEHIRTTKLLPTVGRALGALNALSSEATARAKAQLGAVRSARSTAAWVIVALVVAGLLVSILLGLLVATAVMRPVRLVRDILDSVARNDLSRTADVRSRDELGQMAASLNTSISHLRSLHAELNHQALHDGLTGLPNRTALIQSLEAELSHGTGRSCLLFIDLDGFKAVNDGAGHAAGDALLVAVASRISASLRSNDIVARLGGDEFLVQCRGVDDPAVATQTAERILARLAEPFLIDGNEVSIRASIGIAVSNANSTADSLIREADVAMYRSKLGGRGRSLVFSPPSLAAI